MVASREKQHGHRLTKVASLGFKILPVAAIYGGNGSGKSNFYHALKFAKSLVLKTKNPEESIDFEPFRLNEHSESKPSTFAFEILIKSQVFKYSFTVSRKRVLDESLEVLKGTKTTLVFSRHVAKNEDNWNLEYFQKADLPKEEEEFVKFKARDTLPNQLFLNAVRGKKILVLETLIKWFRSTLILIDPETTSGSMEFSSKKQEKLRSFCIEALNKAHTGIDKIEGEEISAEAVDLPKGLKEMLKEKLKDDEAAQVVSPDRKRYSFYREKGEYKWLQLVTYHRGENGRQIRFDVSDESEGTQRLIDLLPSFHELLSGSERVFVIDELDRSLHTLLTRNLLESYLLARSKDSKSQLIFTTHDGLLMDQELFRRDEFWFIDKDTDGASVLTALSDFKDVRYDKDIRKSYLLGRFGGIPIIRSFPHSSTS